MSCATSKTTHEKQVSDDYSNQHPSETSHNPNLSLPAELASVNAFAKVRSEEKTWQPFGFPVNATRGKPGFTERPFGQELLKNCKPFAKASPPAFTSVI